MVIRVKPWNIFLQYFINNKQNIVKSLYLFSISFILEFNYPKDSINILFKLSEGSSLNKRKHSSTFYTVTLAAVLFPILYNLIFIMLLPSPQLVVKPL